MKKNSKFNTIRISDQDIPGYIYKDKRFNAEIFNKNGKKPN